MSIECPNCKSPVAREGQRFCYRCGHDLQNYYDSLSIKVNEVAADEPRAAASGNTEVLGSEPAVGTTQEPVGAGSRKATLRILLPTGDTFDRQIRTSEVQLGKGPRNDIVVADPAVSTAHATIKSKGDAYIVTDLGSRNGTFVNGERLSGTRELRHGDVIGIGLSKLTFRFSDYSETGAIEMTSLGAPAPAAVPPLTQEALAEAVVKEGLASASDVARLRGSGSTKRRLALGLVEEGLVDETALCDLFSRTFRIPRVDLQSIQIDEKVATSFSGRIARDHRVFPFGDKSGVMLLAMADPTDTAAIERIEREMKTMSAQHVATFGEIREQIEKYYGPKLIGVMPSGENLRFLINQPEIEIGKAPHNHLVVSDPTVSNTHAVLLVRDGGYSIVDLGSRNGTFVSGERLGTQPRTLRHGDTIQLGQTVLTFRNSGETPENITATLSPAKLEELRKRAEELASSDSESASEPGAEPSDAVSPATDSGQDDKKKKKKKKKGKDERLKAAYIGGLSRILAQVLAVILAVLLALYVNSSMRSGSEKPVIETSSKGKAKVKLAKPGAGFSFTGGVFEASGVVQVPGSPGVYFVDDSKPGEILLMPLDESGKQAGEIKSIAYGAAVADPEGITYGGSFFYVAGSQSHKETGERNAIVRFAFDASNQTVQGQAEVVEDLRGFLFKNAAELAPYADRKGNEGGLNVEGVSWDPAGDRLLLGLRSPVIDGKALIVPLKLRDPRGAFSADNLVAGPVMKLSLDGLGFRDIQYDTRSSAFLIVAGAPVHGEAKDFSLWEWTGDTDASGEASGLREVTKLDGNMKPEGVTRVKVGSSEFLFIVGDSSRYLKLDFADE